MDSAVLSHRIIARIEGKFRVAKYQRGYRWEPGDVERLLDDIHSSTGRSYCLQPIVVGLDKDGTYELIDGQQRLTTLYLLLSYLSRNGNLSFDLPYSIEYDTRKASTAYLQALAENPHPDPTLAEADVDAYHMYAAYEAIENWFARKGGGGKKTIALANIASRMLNDLSENVSVIWYEVPDGESATALFTRLNIGRIPLTDAELVKALLVAKSRDLPGATNRAIEIATRWDQIEHDLLHPDIWGFVSDNAIASSPTRILLLLDALAGGPFGELRPRYHTFDEIKKMVDSEGAAAVWDKVVAMHALVLGWFEDRNLYHKIGYLVATGYAFAALVSKANGKTKREFLHFLDSAIRGTLQMTALQIAELSYERNQAKCHRVLLLMNVETIRRLNQSTERYPFRHHRAETWSLEHIHAQNSEQLTTADQWKKWLELHRDALMNLGSIEEPERKDLVERIAAALGNIDKLQFDVLARDVLTVFSTRDNAPEDISYSMHSISNLALLESGHNSALNNAVFEVKRRRILDLDRQGEYIPICTRQVFLKYFTNADAQHVHFWSRKDQEAYLSTILSRKHGVGEYLETAGAKA